jgi:hypothetical protein
MKNIPAILISLFALIGLFALWIKWDANGIVINLAFVSIGLLGIWQLWFKANTYIRKKKIVLTAFFSVVIFLACKNLYLQEHKQFAVIGMALIFITIMMQTEKFQKT